MKQPIKILLTRDILESILLGDIVKTESHDGYKVEMLLSDIGMKELARIHQKVQNHFAGKGS